MLSPPPWFVQMVQQKSPPRASAQDVERLRALAPLPVPESYFELITRYGLLEFETSGEPCCFKYSYREPEMAMSFEGEISHFMEADRVERYYANLVTDEEAGDTPKFPAFMLPIGLDFGQNNILLECGGESDRVWFWEYQEEPWGEGNNVRLGFVAETVNDFLGALYVPQS